MHLICSVFGLRSFADILYIHFHSAYLRTRMLLHIDSRVKAQRRDNRKLSWQYSKLLIVDLRTPNHLCWAVEATTAFMHSTRSPGKTTQGWTFFREKSSPAIGLHNEQPQASDVCRDLIKISSFGKPRPRFSEP